jgi:hypothetical protein
MRRIRIVGLCLVAMFAMSAIASATASAAPQAEFWQAKNACTKLFEPVWNGGTCKGKAKAATKIAFTSTGTKSFLEGGLEITCSSDTSKGDIEGSTQIKKLKISYVGCKETAHPATPCEKTVSKPELISTESIKGKLENAESTIGSGPHATMHFTPETKPYFAKFVCGTSGHTINVEVKGGVFATISPVFATANVSNLSTAGKTINEAQAKVAGCGWKTGAQKWLYKEGSTTCEFLKVVENGAELEPSGNISSDSETFKTAVEVVGEP